MYEMIWNSMPGPTWFKATLAVIVVVALVFLLLEVVFPWLGPIMPFGESAVGDPGVAPATPGQEG